MTVYYVENACENSVKQKEEILIIIFPVLTSLIASLCNFYQEEVLLLIKAIPARGCWFHPDVPTKDITVTLFTITTYMRTYRQAEQKPN